MSTEPEVLTPNLPGKKKPANTPKRAVVAGEDGYHGEPLVIGDVTFYLRRVKKAPLRAFSKETRRIPREMNLLAKKQQAELEAVQAEDENADLSDERWEYYDGEGERLAGELDAAYNALLKDGVYAWSRSEPFSPELIESLEDKKTICLEIGARSTSGFSTVKN